MEKLNITNKQIPETYAGFIYKTIFPNGKIYVGQSTKRINIIYFGSGKDCEKAIKEHGKKNLIREILRFCATQIQLDFWEAYWIKKLKATDPEVGYNILPGTANKFGKVNMAKLPIIRERMSLAQIKWNKEHPLIGVKRSEMMKEYYINNPDAIINLREKMKGSKNGIKTYFPKGHKPINIEQLKEINKGKKYALGHKRSKENKKKDSVRNSGDNNPMSRLNIERRRLLNEK